MADLPTKDEWAAALKVIAAAAEFLKAKPYLSSAQCRKLGEKIGAGTYLRDAMERYLEVLKSDGQG